MPHQFAALFFNSILYRVDKDFLISHNSWHCQKPLLTQAHNSLKIWELWSQNQADILWQISDVQILAQTNQLCMLSYMLPPYVCYPHRTHYLSKQYCTPLHKINRQPKQKIRYWKITVCKTILNTGHVLKYLKWSIPGSNLFSFSRLFLIEVNGKILLPLILM